MSPENHQPNSENTNAELAFVQQALAAADRSERTSRLIVGVLAILAVVVFIWMHIHMRPDDLAGLLHSILRVDLFFLIIIFAVTMYIRQVMNNNTRTILRALANTRQR
jgi:heme/copper-type cytochrome/quinol oxidase subunit 4